MKEWEKAYNLIHLKLIIFYQKIPKGDPAGRQKRSKPNSQWHRMPHILASPTDPSPATDSIWTSTPGEPITHHSLSLHQLMVSPPSFPLPAMHSVMAGYKSFHQTKPLGCVIIANTWAGWLLVIKRLSINCHELFITHITCPWLSMLMGQQQLHIPSSPRKLWLRAS